LRNLTPTKNTNVGIVDAFSSGKALPIKNGGVG